MKRRTVQYLICLERMVQCLLFRRSRFFCVTLPFARNQMVFDRFASRFVRVTTRGAADWETMNQVFLQEDYALRRLTRARDLRGSYEEIVASGRRPLVVDCGANIGLASKYFAMEFPEALVLAVEPDASNLDVARKNCRGERVVFVNGAVSGSDGFGVVTNHEAGANALRVESVAGGGLPMHSMNTLLAHEDLKECTPFLLKIDIEGSESELFTGDTSWIDRFPILTIELHDWLVPRAGTSRSFLGCMSARDRDFVYFGENVFSISNELC